MLTTAFVIIRNLSKTEIAELSWFVVLINTVMLLWRLKEEKSSLILLKSLRNEPKEVASEEGAEVYRRSTNWQVLLAGQLGKV